VPPTLLLPTDCMTPQVILRNLLNTVGIKEYKAINVRTY
jgi:hypothetical protein